MNTQKLISSITLCMVAMITLLLPLTLSLTVFFSSATIIIAYHFLIKYRIDYQFLLSFISQLLALIIIAVSFLMTLTVGFNWLTL